MKIKDYDIIDQISMFDKVIGTRTSDGDTFNFEMAGIVAIVLALITGGGIKGWLYINPIEDGNTLSSPSLIGAEKVDLIVSNNQVMKNPVDEEDFDSETGTISNYPVFAGEQHLVFFTKPTL